MHYIYVSVVVLVLSLLKYFNCFSFICLNTLLPRSIINSYFPMHRYNNCAQLYDFVVSMLVSIKSVKLPFAFFVSFAFFTLPKELSIVRFASCVNIYKLFSLCFLYIFYLSSLSLLVFCVHSEFRSREYLFTCFYSIYIYFQFRNIFTVGM